MQCVPVTSCDYFGSSGKLFSTVQRLRKLYRVALAAWCTRSASTHSEQKIVVSNPSQGVSRREFYTLQCSCLWICLHCYCAFEANKWQKKNFVQKMLLLYVCMYVGMYESPSWRINRLGNSLSFFFQTHLVTLVEIYLGSRIFGKKSIKIGKGILT
jgi:hypothetical protein